MLFFTKEFGIIKETCYAKSRKAEKPYENPVCTGFI